MPLELPKCQGDVLTAIVVVAVRLTPRPSSPWWRGCGSVPLGTPWLACGSRLAPRGAASGSQRRRRLADRRSGSGGGSAPPGDLARREAEPGESRGGLPQPSHNDTTTEGVRHSTTATFPVRTPLLALGVQGAREAAPWSGRRENRRSIRGHLEGADNKAILRPRRRSSPGGHPRSPGPVDGAIGGQFGDTRKERIKRRSPDQEGSFSTSQSCCRVFSSWMIGPGRSARVVTPTTSKPARMLRSSMSRKRFSVWVRTTR